MWTKADRPQTLKEKEIKNKDKKHGKVLLIYNTPILYLSCNKFAKQKK